MRLERSALHLRSHSLVPTTITLLSVATATITALLLAIAATIALLSAAVLVVVVVVIAAALTLSAESTLARLVVATETTRHSVVAEGILAALATSSTITARVASVT